MTSEVPDRRLVSIDTPKPARYSLPRALLPGPGRPGRDEINQPVANDDGVPASRQLRMQRVRITARAQRPQLTLCAIEPDGALGRSRELAEDVRGSLAVARLGDQDVELALAVDLDDAGGEGVEGGEQGRVGGGEAGGGDGGGEGRGEGVQRRRCEGVPCFFCDAGGDRGEHAQEVG